MIRFFAALACTVFLSTQAPAQEITADQLRAMVDERAGMASPMMALLNDPDPVRSLAAVELMIESGDPKLKQMAIDFGVLSAAPEVRRAAFLGFLNTRPTLLLNLDISGNEDENFEDQFRRSTDGSVLGTERATYSVNVGVFDTEKNCFLLTSTELCAVEVGPTGIAVYKQNPVVRANFIRTYLEFGDPGQFAGSSQVNKVSGGFPTTLAIVD